MRPAAARLSAEDAGVVRVFAWVEELFGTTFEQLQAPDRTPATCKARFVAMAALVARGLTVADVARLLGLDQSTITHGMAVVNGRPDLHAYVRDSAWQPEALPWWRDRLLRLVPERDRLALAAYIDVLTNVARRPGQAAAYGQVLVQHNAAYAQLVAQILERSGQDLAAARHALQHAHAPVPVHVVTPVVPREEVIMPRIELIDPTTIPSVRRNPQSVTEAATWLRKAGGDHQAIIVRLGQGERPTTVINSFRRAAEVAHLEISITRGPDRRAYTTSRGVERQEATTLYVRILDPISVPARAVRSA